MKAYILLLHFEYAVFHLSRCKDDREKEQYLALIKSLTGKMKMKRNLLLNNRIKEFEQQKSKRMLSKKALKRGFKEMELDTFVSNTEFPTPESTTPVSKRRRLRACINDKCAIFSFVFDISSQT